MGTIVIFALGQGQILANRGIIAGSAVGIAVFVIALLIVVSIAVCAVTRRSKWSSLNQSYASVHEMDSRNAPGIVRIQKWM